MRHFVQAFGAAVLLGAASCASPTANTNLITMTAVSSKNILIAGATSDITFIISNGTAESITFSTNVCPGLLEVIDAQGSVVFSAENLLILCSAEVRPVTLGAGDQYSWSEQWNGAGRNTQNPTSPRVAPGAYQVRARLVNFGHLVLENRPATVVVQ